MYVRVGEPLLELRRRPPFACSTSTGVRAPTRSLSSVGVLQAGDVRAAGARLRRGEQRVQVGVEPDRERHDRHLELAPRRAARRGARRRRQRDLAHRQPDAVPGVDDRRGGGVGHGLADSSGLEHLDDERLRRALAASSSLSTLPARVRQAPCGPRPGSNATGVLARRRTSPSSAGSGESARAPRPSRTRATSASRSIDSSSARRTPGPGSSVRPGRRSSVAASSVVPG